jgi:TatD DNase family protein
VGWVDIGVNLSNKQFDGDREQVVERACQAGADWLVLTGTDLSESESVLATVITPMWPVANGKSRIRTA